MSGTLYRVTQRHGSNQGYWQTSRTEVVYLGYDKRQAFAEYLRLEPYSGAGCPGSHGYLLEFESGSIDDADHPDEIEWQDASEV